MVFLLASPFVIHARDLRQTISTSCKTGASSTLTVISGTGFAASSAFCQAEVNAKIEIQKVTVAWVADLHSNPDTGCTLEFSTLAANGFAEAMAAAYASAGASAEIEGTGTACAEGSADSNALAVVLLDSAVESSLEAIEDKYGSTTRNKVQEGIDNAEASGEALVPAAASVISTAGTLVYQSACTNGQPVETSDESFVREVREVSSYIFGEISLTLCQELGLRGEEDRAAWNRLLDESPALAVTPNGAENEAVTPSGTIPEPCTGEKQTICCGDAFKGSDTCPCGENCQLNASLEDQLASDVKIWEDVLTEEKCSCS